MRFYIILLSIFYFADAEDAINSISKTHNNNLFITDYEYGQMLYNNPRGIGCSKCHGKDGKGQFIARYTHKKKEYEIHSPTITNISLNNFIKILKSKSNSKSIMPTYFLTNDEMKQIHYYITNRQDDE